MYNDMSNNLEIESAPNSSHRIVSSRLVVFLPLPALHAVAKA